MLRFFLQILPNVYFLLHLLFNILLVLRKSCYLSQHAFSGLSTLPDIRSKLHVTKEEEIFRLSDFS